MASMAQTILEPAIPIASSNVLTQAGLFRPYDSIPGKRGGSL
jgi:hypothetical protein